MNRLATEFKGKTTPVLEVRSLTSDKYDSRFIWLFLDDAHELIDEKLEYPSYWDEWKSFFTEEDVKRIEGLEGVETVVRVLDCEVNVKPDKIPYQEEVNKRIKELLEDQVYEAWRNGALELAASWNMTLIDYWNMTGSYRTTVARCLELDKIMGWSLGFDEEAAAEIPPSELSSSIIVNEFMLNDFAGLKVGEKAYFLIGQVGSYNMNGTWHQYDRRHIYAFDVVESTHQLYSSWSSSEPNIVADLDTFMNILRRERSQNGASLPIYSTLLVKPATPMDLIKVEEYIKGLYPDKRTMRTGTAPITIGEKAAQAETGFKAMAFNYTLASAGILAALLLAEAYRNRKMIWLLKTRGWGRLDMISYTLVRTALLGLIAGCIGAVVVFAGKSTIISVLTPVEIMTASPEVAKLATKAVNDAFTSYMVTALPLLGVTAAVLSSIPVVIYSDTTKPRENLYDDIQPI